MVYSADGVPDVLFSPAMMIRVMIRMMIRVVSVAVLVRVSAEGYPEAGRQESGLVLPYRCFQETNQPNATPPIVHPPAHNLQS